MDVQVWDSLELLDKGVKALARRGEPFPDAYQAAMYLHHHVRIEDPDTRLFLVLYPESRGNPTPLHNPDSEPFFHVHLELYHHEVGTLASVRLGGKDDDKIVSDWHGYAGAQMDTPGHHDPDVCPLCASLRFRFGSRVVTTRPAPVIEEVRA